MATFAQDLPNFVQAIEGRTGCLICIDWGKAFCGLAITDPKLSVAMPLEIVQPAKLISRATSLNKEYGLRGIVIGLPFKLDFSAIHATGKDIIALSEEIDNALEIPVLLWDERMSTVGAFNMLHFGQIKSQANNSRIRRKGKSKRPQRNDDGAAQFILDGLLEPIRNLLDQNQKS